MIIGVTGKSGSGKGYISSLLCDKYDCFYLDVDKVAHLVCDYKDVRKILIDNFGDNFIIDNKIDRKIFGNILFSSKEKMDKVIQITWPRINEYVLNFIEENKNRNIILDWAMLPITSLFDKCDIKILVKSPYKLRIKRCIERDHIDESKFLERESAGIEYSEEDYNFVINNDGINKINLEGIL